MARVLLFAPHPDDLEVHMGGALLALAAAGHDLQVVHLTDGEAGTRQPERGSRRDEARRALEPLGAQLAWGKLPDGGLSAEASLASWLARAVSTGGGYDAVFGPHPSDVHADHAAVGAHLPLAAGTVPLWFWADCRGRVTPSHVFAPAMPWGEKELLIRVHASQIPGPGEARAHLPGGLDIVERARQRDESLGALIDRAWGEPFVRAGAEGERPVLLEDVAAFFER